MLIFLTIADSPSAVNHSRQYFTAGPEKSLAWTSHPSLAKDITCLPTPQPRSRALLKPRVFSSFERATTFRLGFSHFRIVSSSRHCSSHVIPFLFLVRAILFGTAIGIAERRLREDLMPDPARLGVDAYYIPF